MNEVLSKRRRSRTFATGSGCKKGRHYHRRTAGKRLLSEKIRKTRRPRGEGAAGFLPFGWLGTMPFILAKRRGSISHTAAVNPAAPYMRDANVNDIVVRG